MDYEKKYNDALERARKVHRNYKNLFPEDSYSEDIEEIFPELRESEDERMMREFNDWLCEEIECRTNDLRDEKDRRTLNMLCYILTKVKDWLEKQKEPHFTKRNALFDKCVENCDPEVMKEVSNKVDEMLGKEQKPELVQHPPITYTYNSNASRDERLKAALLALLNSDLIKVKEGGYFTKQDLIEWVVRIPTDKPAWSEEDDQLIGFIFDLLNDLSWRKDWAMSKEECLERLKSLRPSWKPSDHQMNILKAVKEYVGRGSGYWGEGLGSLIEDLEKLM